MTTETTTLAEGPAIAATIPEQTDEVSTGMGEVETAPTPDQPSDAAEKPKGVQKRLDELTRNWREAERREQALLELLKQRTPAEPESPKQDAFQPKTLADFEYDEAKYQTYLFQEATKAATAAARQELQSEAARRAEEQRKSTFSSREKAFAAKNPDYMTVTRNENVPITQQMAEVIAESEDGPALAYHLAKNVELAENIARLPALAQARELGRVEAQLAYERKAAEEARKRVSQAPAPTPRIEAVENEVEQDPDKMTVDEWKKWRDKRDRLKNLRK